MTRLLLSALLLIPLFSYCQKFEWAASAGGPSTDVPYSVTSNGFGDVLTVGAFIDSADFDPSNSTVRLVSAGGDDGFLWNLNGAGSLNWVKGISGQGSTSINVIQKDALNNYYLVGDYSGTVDFDPDTGTFISTSTGPNHSDIFILKLDNNGTFQWVKFIGNSLSETVYDFKIDLNNNLILTGFFNSTLDFDPDTSIYQLSSNGGQDIFVLKLSNNGSFIWAKSVGGSLNDKGRAVDFDSDGNIYYTGNYVGTVDFDPGSGVQNVTSAGSVELFISKLDSLGNFVWASGMGGNSVDEGFDIKVSSTGIYTTGVFSTTADFDPTSGTSNLTSIGMRDAFILKLDYSGNLDWIRSVGSVNNDYGHELVLDQFENVYIGGNFNGQVDFDPSSSIYNVNSLGSSDIFLLNLSDSGHFNSVQTFGGSGYDGITDLHFTVMNKLLVTGTFNGTVDFNPDTNSIFNLSSNGGADIFVSQFDLCTESYERDTIIACNNFFWSQTGIKYTQTGAYSDTLSNSFGCDSIITLQLSIQSLDTTVIISGNSLIASASNSSYQWIDCNNGNSPLIGDTNRIFTPSVNGNYAVIIDNGNCSDTSACIQHIITDLKEKNKSSYVSLYPNPSQNGRIIINSKYQNSIEVRVLSITGQLLTQKTFNGSGEHSVDLPFEPGTYLIEIGVDNIFERYKVIRD